MKKIFLGLILVSASIVSVNAQAIAPKPAAATTTAAQTTMSFKEPDFTHDFGAIPQGTPVNYNFVFTNTGKAPLVLTSATGSCGCTVAEWPKEAIAPGKTGVIKVTYNAASPNTFDRTVTLASNANPVVLHIKGDVKTPAPAAATQSTQPALTQQAAAPK
ncbi:MAG: DUF1573 domain-containing protein, partial [Sediminibacterium sp.]